MDTKKKFLGLTPDRNIALGVYEEAVNFALENNENINNVAITGVYGAGKSSMLETYENKHPDKKFLFRIFEIIISRKPEIWIFIFIFLQFFSQNLLTKPNLPVIIIKYAAQRGLRVERPPYLASKVYRRCHKCTQLLQQVVNSTKLLKAT